MTETKNPNVGEGLIRFHHVVTRGLDVALQASEKYQREEFPDNRTRDGFYTYVECLTRILHAHHLSEDELAFPCFKLHLPGVPIETLMADHQAMQPMLRALGEATKTRQNSLPKIHATLVDLHELWHRHIGKEENYFSCNALAEVLKPVEHIALEKQLSAHGRKLAQPGSLTLPFILFNLPPEERAVMMNFLPPIVTKVLIPVVWKRKWAVMKPFLLQ